MKKKHNLRAEILPTATRRQFELAVRRASELLQNGDVVALPTETVYGLAANALDAPAVERLFEIKGRPTHNPVIVHVANLDMARSCVSNWPASARKLATAFWPGPLTLVMARAKRIPDAVTAGGTTVGVRWPSHPFIQAVIRTCGFPLAAPSANVSGQLSPTRAEHVAQQLRDKIKLIVDGGASQVGIESTVVDLTARPLRLLRPGMIDEQTLMAATGDLRIGEAEAGAVLRSPGLLLRHYSPKARLVVLSWRDDKDLSQQLSKFRIARAKIHILARARIPCAAAYGCVSVMARNVPAFARALYSELHRCDEAGAELIVVENPPSAPQWRAIADRLGRAAA